MFLVSSPSEGQDPLISTGHGCSGSELGSICYKRMIQIACPRRLRSTPRTTIFHSRLVDHGISLDLHSFLEIFLMGLIGLHGLLLLVATLSRRHLNIVRCISG